MKHIMKYLSVAVVAMATLSITSCDEEYVTYTGPEYSEGDYEIEILDSSVRISCKCCGASKEIPTNSLIAANEFLNADSIILE